MTDIVINVRTVEKEEDEITARKGQAEAKAEPQKHEQRT